MHRGDPAGVHSVWLINVSVLIPVNEHMLFQARGFMTSSGDLWEL